MNKKTNTLNQTDAAYLAGLIDGEGTKGTIGLSVVHKNNRRSPVLSIANTDYTLVEWPLQVIGTGSISKKGKKRLPHHLDSYIYAIHHDNVLELLKQIYPYLKNKSKRARAALLLDKYKALTPRNGKYSPSQLTARQKFEEEFLSL